MLGNSRTRGQINKQSNGSSDHSASSPLHVNKLLRNPQPSSSGGRLARFEQPSYNLDTRKQQLSSDSMLSAKGNELSPSSFICDPNNKAIEEQLQQPKRTVAFEKFWKFYSNSYNEAEYAHFFAPKQKTKRDTPMDGEFSQTGFDLLAPPKSGVNETEEDAKVDEKADEVIEHEGFEKKTAP